uniref:Uncharacterized protein n=1 Tax=Romanomermis culicivorax TaxID=13658 RepID=A0A915KWT2_ROMCU
MDNKAVKITKKQPSDESKQPVTATVAAAAAEPLFLFTDLAKDAAAKSKSKKRDSKFPSGIGSIDQLIPGRSGVYGA